MAHDRRSSRLSETLLSCSINPHTPPLPPSGCGGGTHAERRHAILYSEAKLALNRGDTESARKLFQLCPLDYKRTSTYRQQCDIYEELCADGLVHRVASGDLRDALSTMIDAPEDCIAKYAEALHAAGYTRSGLEGLTRDAVHGLAAHAKMHNGHRVQLVRHVEARMPAWHVGFYRLAEAVERCVVAIHAVRTATAAASKHAASLKASADDARKAAANVTAALGDEGEDKAEERDEDDDDPTGREDEYEVETGGI